MAFKNDFRPDIIAGNPPYNNGTDIDFVFDAFEVAKVAVAEITPAKFQTAEADQKITSQHSYGDFRSELVPHIKELVFYPEAAEIFEIRNTDGIVHYTIDKNNIHENCKVVNHCRHQKYFESEAMRPIIHRETFHNIGYEIIKYMNITESFKFETDENHRYAVWTGNQINGGNGWGYSNRKDPTATFNEKGVF